MFPASTKGGGAHVTTGPLDACKTPTPGGPIPIPYANMVDGLAASGDEAAKRTKKKIIDSAAEEGYSADSATAASIAGYGDEAGTIGGIVSSKQMRKGRFRMGASKVKAEGKKIVHATAMTAHNGSSANVPAGTHIAPSQTKVVIMGG